jgi:phosphoglycerate dehydrogenase-like enzyme
MNTPFGGLKSGRRMKDKNKIEERFSFSFGKGFEQVIYFIGIGGIGMSAIARFLHAGGMKVSGYDKTPTCTDNGNGKKRDPCSL